MLDFAGWAVVLVVVLGLFGLNELSLALSGVVAILALGVSQVVGRIINDLISGVFLVVDDEFRAGTRVKVGNVEGTVVSLGIRKTKIRDFRGDVYVIPNREIDSSTYLVKPPRRP